MKLNLIGSLTMPAAESTSINGSSRTLEEVSAELAAMKEEFQAMKAEVEHLRLHCDNMQRTLNVLCCPKEWYTEEIDEDEIEEALAHPGQSPTIQELIDEFKSAEDGAS
jgi:regulator of replication initiation timing